MWLESKNFYICDQQQLEANSQLSNLYSTNYLDTRNNSDECRLQIHSGDGVVRLEVVYKKGFDKVLFYDGADEQATLLDNAIDNDILITSGEYLYIKYTADAVTTGPTSHFRFTSG